MPRPRSGLLEGGQQVPSTGVRTYVGRSPAPFEAEDRPDAQGGAAGQRPAYRAGPGQGDAEPRLGPHVTMYIGFSTGGCPGTPSPPGRRGCPARRPRPRPRRAPVHLHADPVLPGLSNRALPSGGCAPLLLAILPQASVTLPVGTSEAANKLVVPCLSQSWSASAGSLDIAAGSLRSGPAPGPGSAPRGTRQWRSGATARAARPRHGPWRPVPGRWRTRSSRFARAAGPARSWRRSRNSSRALPATGSTSASPPTSRAVITSRPPPAQPTLSEDQPRLHRRGLRPGFQHRPVALCQQQRANANGPNPSPQPITVKPSPTRNISQSHVRLVARAPGRPVVRSR